MIAIARPQISEQLSNCKQLVAVKDFLHIWHAVFKQQRCSNNELSQAIDRCVYAWTGSERIQERVMASWAAGHGALLDKHHRVALKFAKRCVQLCRKHQLGNCLWQLSNELMWHVYQDRNDQERSAFWQSQYQSCKHFP